MYTQELYVRLEMESPRNIVANFPLVYKVQGKLRTDFIKSEVIDGYGIERAVIAKLNLICFIYKVKLVKFNCPFNYIHLDNDFIVSSNTAPPELIKVGSKIRKYELNSLPKSLDVLKRSKGKFSSEVYEVLKNYESCLPRIIIKTHLVELFSKEMLKRKDTHIPVWMTELLQYKY